MTWSKRQVSCLWQKRAETLVLTRVEKKKKVILNQDFENVLTPIYKHLIRVTLNPEFTVFQVFGHEGGIPNCHWINAGSVSQRDVNCSPTARRQSRVYVSCLFEVKSCFLLRSWRSEFVCNALAVKSRETDNESFPLIRKALELSATYLLNLMATKIRDQQKKQALTW